jgi:hypothetical protein
MVRKPRLSGKMSFFRAVAVAALIPCLNGCRDAAAPSPVPPGIGVLSGNNQEAPDGSRVTAPLAARVTRAGGSPAAGVEVVWQVSRGRGVFRSYPDDLPLATSTSVTDTAGVARIFFEPKDLLQSTITATAVGIAPTPASFVATGKPNVEIDFSPLFDCTPFSDPSVFSSNRSSDLSAPLDAKVGLTYFKGLSLSCTARVKTTMIPVGAEAFDTGILTPGQTFIFVPKVAGVWEFTDVINGGNGRLVVH